MMSNRNLNQIGLIKLIGLFINECSISFKLFYNNFSMESLYEKELKIERIR